MPTAGAVLIVDNDLAAAEALATYLRQLGFEVRTAATAALAAAAVVGWTPDAAILDLATPDQAAAATAATLARHSRRPLRVALLRPGTPRTRTATDRDLF